MAHTVYVDFTTTIVAAWANDVDTITYGMGSTSGKPLVSTGSGTLPLYQTLGVVGGGTGVATLTGLVKGNGTLAFTAAVAGTDYAVATTGSSILKADGAGGFTAALGTDVTTLIGTNAVTNATNSVNLSGTIASGVTATTQTAGDNSTKVATTAFVTSTLASSQAAIQGAFKNLSGSSTGTNATITYTVDEVVVENTSNAYQTLRSVSLSINSASSGANGLDTGTIAASTWYSVWVIWNGTTTSGLISTSATAPTMPGGYTHKARVGWVRTDGTANKYPFSFKQYGRRVQWLVAAGGNIATPLIMASGTSAAVWTAVAVGSFVPPTASKINVTLSCLNIFSNAGFSVAPNTAYAATNAYLGLYQGNTNGTNLIVSADLVLESSNIYWGGSSSGTSSLYANGWEDNI